MIQQIDLYSKDFDIYALGEKMNEIIDLLNEKEQTEVNTCVIPDVRICAEQMDEIMKSIRTANKPIVYGQLP